MLARYLKLSFSTAQPLKAAITQKIQQHLKPLQFNIENESHKHSVPKGSETHFKILVVSDDFEGQSRVERQQKVYSLLKEEFKAGLHALSMTTKSKGEWEASQEVNSSPDCMGGSKRK